MTVHTYYIVVTLSMVLIKRLGT